MLKKGYLFIGGLIVLCAVCVIYFIMPFIAHMNILQVARNYQPEAFVSFDNKYILRTVKYKDETGTYASFNIESYETGDSIYSCPDKYRTMDLKSILWADGLYTVTIKSGDVGTIYYSYVDGIWIKNNNKEIEWSVSKYSDITKRYYEETRHGYKAAFYDMSEIDVEKIIDWLASCEQSEDYYQYIYSDPDSWDMFIFYAPPINNFSNNQLRFFISGSTVNIFVENGYSADISADYMLIRIQAPKRGAWPSSSTLHVDGNSIEIQKS